MSRFKDQIRQDTNLYFPKTGICKICKEKKKTTWHHKVYRRPLNEKDFFECCRKCHDIVDRKKPGFKIQRLKGKKGLERIDKIIEVDLAVKKL